MSDLQTGSYKQVEVSPADVAKTINSLVKQQGFLRSITPNVQTGAQNKIVTTYIILYWVNP